MRLPPRMEAELADTGSVTISSRDKKRLSKMEVEIRRLANVAVLLRKSALNGDSSDSEDDDDSAGDGRQKKRKKPTKKNSPRSAAKKRKCVHDMSSGEESGVDSAADNSDEDAKPIASALVPLEQNDFDREQLMASDTSDQASDGSKSEKDNSDLSPSEDDKKKKKKTKKRSKEDDVEKNSDVKKEEGDKSGDEPEAGDGSGRGSATGSGHDSANSRNSGKPKNRKNVSSKMQKLLSGKLSATDSSEEDEKMKAKIQAKKEKEAEAAADKDAESDAVSELEAVTDGLPVPLTLSSTEDEDVVEKKRSPRKKRLVLADSESGSDQCVVLSDDDDDDESAGPSSKKRGHSSSSPDSSERSSDDFVPAKKTRSRARLKRIRRMSDDSRSSDSSDDSDEEQKDSQGTPGKGGRKNIRHIREAEVSTKQAAQAEQERRKRIEEKMSKYNELFSKEDDSEEPEALTKLVLDFDTETKNPLVSVHKNFVKILKPHQVDGVKFMFDSTVETVARLNDEENSQSAGCILAHCMGLGKTLQVVVLLHTLLESPETRQKLACALVVCPKNTVQNWVRELKTWQKKCRVPEVDVIDITFRKDNYERSFELEQWRTEGGVCVLSYDMYKRFTGTGGKKGYNKKQLDRFQKALVDPGPDFVVCDEGHLLKNPRTAAFKSLNQMKCNRRVILTGTPLQNNLREYHTMVEIVKPRLLGSESEFSNRFIRPIENGSAVDAMPRDVKLMKRRSHVLHKLLDSVVQRRDYNVLTPFLPAKHEYTVLVSLSDVQRRLYSAYLAGACQGGVTRRVLADFHALSRVWTHPRCVQMKDEQDEAADDMKQEKLAMDKFVADGSDTSSEDETSDKEKASGDEKADGQTEESQNEWWHSCIPNGVQLDDIELSGKLTLLNEVLIKCENIGDKLLVFSQSLFTLNLIEEHLERLHKEMQKSRSGKEKHRSHVYFGTWRDGHDYYRLDGSTPEDRRQMMCDRINKASNQRGRLMLISTKAGGLGINLVGANRVVIFDASWNPTADSQAIFRVFRFGQVKASYVYRFIAQGCMEEKIYDRQISKLSLACRVVDEQQVERHFNQHDVEELYEFEPDRKRTTGNVVPKDDLLLMDLVKEQSKWISSVHGHDSLLQNVEEEELNVEEQRAAWEEYENDRKGVPNVGDVIPLVQGKAIDKATVIEMIKKDNPTATDNEVLLMIPKAIQTLRAFYFKKQQEERRKKEQEYLRALQQQRQNLYGYTGADGNNASYTQMMQQMMLSQGAAGGLPANQPWRMQNGAASEDLSTYNQLLRQMLLQQKARPPPRQSAGPSGVVQQASAAGVQLPKHLNVVAVPDGKDKTDRKGDKPSRPPAVVDIT